MILSNLVLANATKPLFKAKTSLLALIATPSLRSDVHHGPHVDKSEERSFQGQILQNAGDLPLLFIQFIDIVLINPTETPCGKSSNIKLHHSHSNLVTAVNDLDILLPLLTLTTLLLLLL